ncbi:hypothetical protein [Gorillibacterium sp. CAU 1737]|uniref:hypothetical protein n=1 Tax=Gorillibacterium sp. CAU 1737 TaxID=3140362 RepID=UPI0032613F96
MFRLLKDGWASAWRQPFALFLLFLYRFAWAFVLFKLVKAHVVPILARYPGAHGPEGGSQLFLMEAQFRLAKSDLAGEVLWGLLLLLGLRMLITPFLNAGVFYSLVHTHLNTGYRFMKGVRMLSLSFFVYYLLQMTLTLVPLFWLFPAIHSVNDLYRVAAQPNTLLLYAAAYAAYGYLLHLLFLHLQFGRASEQPFLSTLIRAVTSSLSILGLAALLLLLTGLLSAGVVTAALWDAGLWTFLLYQAFSFVRTFLSLWGITAQHELFMRKSEHV